MEEISLKGGILMARLSGGREVLRVAVGNHLDPNVMDKLAMMRRSSVAA